MLVSEVCRKQVEVMAIASEDGKALIRMQMGLK